MPDGDDILTDQEERMVNEEYKIWKKNTPFLYDLVITHALEWPSLTVQWLPKVEEHGGLKTQKLVIGTHTSDSEPNHLMIAEVALPVEESEYDARAYDEQKSEVGGVGAAGAVPPGVGHVTVKVMINHAGEVNRARAMPQNEFLIATKTASADVLVFDWRQHTSKPEPSGKPNPFLRLLGHDVEGYGLAWNPTQQRPGVLLSGSDDANICIWDIAGAKTGSLAALSKLNSHSGVVEDVAWHCSHSDLFASVGDDKRLLLWDMRAGERSNAVECHTAEVNCVAYSPFEEWLIATGSADHTVVLHDARMLQQPLHRMTAHREEVFQIGWSPAHPTILASCGADRRLNVWALHKIGDAQSEEDREDGPPELLFVHGGHTAKISDFAWNPASGSDFLIASVAEDNVLQIWQPAEEIYTRDENVDNNVGAATAGSGDAGA